MSLIVFRVIDNITQAPLGNVLLSSTGGPGPWQALTNGCGDCFTDLTPGVYSITFTHSGYIDRVLPANLANPGVITVGLDRSAPTFKQAPRFWRGNICGTRVPGLPHVDGGAGDSNLFLSWFYDRYAPEHRALIRADHKAKGLTHFLLSWPDSRAAGRSPEQFQTTCIELIQDGFFPCVMLTSKVYDPTDTPGILANIEQVLPLLVGIVPMFCVGWELSLWLSPTTVQELINALAPKITPSGAYLYVHFQQGYGSFQQPGKFFADFWNLNVGKLHGLLHQKILTQTPSEYRGESGGLVDILERFAGGFGVNPDSGFGHPFDLVAFEITAQTQFDGSTSEAQGNTLGQWAITTPAVNGVGVMGSGNGL